MSETENEAKARIEQYLSSNKIDIQNAKAYFFAADMVFLSYIESEIIHGIKFSPVLAYFKSGTNFFQLIALKNVRDAAKRIYNDFLADEKSLDDKIAAHAKLTADTDILWRKYKSINNPTDNDRLRFFKELIVISNEWWHYGVIGEDKGRVIDEDIVPIFEKDHNIDAERAHEVVSTLSHPEVQAAFSLERKDFYEMCLLVFSSDLLMEAVIKGDLTALENDPDFSARFDKYRDNYFYKSTDFSDRKLVTIELLASEIKAEIKNSSVVKIKEEISDIANATQKIKTSKAAIRVVMTLTPAEEKLIRFASKTVSWVDERKVGMMKEFYYLFSFFHEIAERYAVPYEDVASLSVVEIEALLASGKKPDFETLGLRKNAFLVVYEIGEKVRIYYGDDANKMFAAAKGTEDTTGELMGSVACKGAGGKITGRVRIVVDALKDPFTDGEILVASMTRIEFVPLMKKSKMIITNEGGIACHAAIVSRELGVPCIVGTKNATEILHNGDMVEADMEKGIIKII